MTTEPLLGERQAAVLSARGRYIILAAAFLGWMCGGVELGMYLAARPAITDILGQTAVLQLAAYGVDPEVVEEEADDEAA